MKKIYEECLLNLSGEMMKASVMADLERGDGTGKTELEMKDVLGLINRHAEFLKRKIEEFDNLSKF